ncbi:MAG TPA: hypothetical protein VN822_05945 [Candidatus Acidoferrales bacterium]|nr:hypothetical protein [Candidatus Acidoferrales bacterium]
MTTLGDWQRHAARFANSHFIVLDPRDADADSRDGATPIGSGSVGAGFRPAPTTDDAEQRDATPILVLIEADEGVHLSLEDEPAFEPFPHPLAQKPISDAAQAALAPHGVAPGATTFDAAEALARVHPLLRHRVF